MHYYGTRLSKNISRREPEGYLLCLNVPVARTGTQDYLPEELGLPPGPGPVPVFRPEEEVFAPDTIASFEGMPVTNDHPPDGVDIENIRRLQMGHAHNVRRGSGEESDLLLADLIITDPRLIEAILAGKREISCGYTYELAEENGQYIQRKIRGNHIAVVDAGRAGKRVCIRDSKAESANPKAPPEPSPRVSIMYRKPDERSHSLMKKSLSKVLARMARDGDAETVAEFIEEMIGEPEEAPVEAAAEAAAEAAEAAAQAVEAAAEEQENPGAVTVTVDSDSLAAILERLDRLISLLTPPAPAEEPAVDEDPVEEIAEAVEEALEAAAPEAELPPADAGEEVARIVESILEPAVSVTLEEDEGDPDDPDKPCAADALRAALSAVRPMLSAMTPAARRKITADISARVRAARRGTGDSAYGALRRAKRARPDPADLGRRIMEKRNPNYRG